MESIPGQPDMLLHGVEVGQFSDCVAISAPLVPDTNLPMLIIRVEIMQQVLLEGGFLTRGAITKGKLYQQGHTVIGPALIEAVEMEKTARFPRVVLSQAILDDLQNWPTKAAIKFDNNYSYIDYITRWSLVHSQSRIEMVKKIVEYGLNNSSLYDKPKYEWLAKKYNELIDNAISLNSQYRHLSKIVIPSLTAK